MAERLSVSTEAARALVKRHRLPRSRANDGKTLAAIDLEEIRHKPLPARSPRDHRAVTDVVATLKARVAQLEAELAQAEERSRGHRRTSSERGRADRRAELFRSIVTFPRGRRPEFALRRPLEFPTVPSEGDFHVGREFLPLAFLREVRRGQRRRPRYCD
jgi:hypothetical protein